MITDRASRIRKLSQGSTTTTSNSRCVVYWMMRDQRIEDNAALQAAVQRAQQVGLPVVVVFWLLSHRKGRTPHAQEYVAFMCEGLVELSGRLKKEFNIPLLTIDSAKYDSPADLIAELEAESVFFDYSPLRGPQTLRKTVAEAHPEVYEVDTHNVVPVWHLSDKQEFAAHTIRRKLHKNITHYLKDEAVELSAQSLSFDTVSVTGKTVLGEWLERYEGLANGVDHGFVAGELAASEQLQSFIKTKLASYGADRNNATVDGVSGLSPYLHFGMISARQIVKAVRVWQIEQGIESDIWLERSLKLPTAEIIDSPLELSAASFLEELIVRRELADNYCEFNKNYDALIGGPFWGLDELEKHADDIREYLYTQDQFEAAETHDKLWNAAQRQLSSTGKIHGYMRMYWAKKILEWSATPSEAFVTATYLNDFYSIDGRDPNGYAGIHWCITGLHDRPWFDKPVFGKVRPMAVSGVAKRFSVDRYCAAYGPNRSLL